MTACRPETFRCDRIQSLLLARPIVPPSVENSRRLALPSVAACEEVTSSVRIMALREVYRTPRGRTTRAELLTPRHGPQQSLEGRLLAPVTQRVTQRSD